MPMFDLEQLLEGARAQYDVGSFGDESLYRPALEALLGSIEADATIEPERVFRTSIQVMMLLATRAKIEERLTAHPQIKEQPITKPVFIVGLLRTGTTMLHNLLARHPAHRAALLWQMRDPLCATDPEAEARSCAETQQVLDLLYQMAPEFQAIHPMRADTPDECSWLFRHSFSTLVYSFLYHVPSYAQWLTQCEMAPYYQYYRSLLQLLQARHPGGRWILKDPCHLWHLDALLEVFPDASIILLHRDLREALPSMASLCFHLHRLESGRHDPTMLAGYCMDLAERGLYSMMRVRKAFPKAKILDVPYVKLLATPTETVREICQFIDSPTQEEDLAQMMRWLTENTQHKAGKHSYSLEQFGFEPRQLKARFGRYQEAFLPAQPL